MPILYNQMMLVRFVRFASLFFILLSASSCFAIEATQAISDREVVCFGGGVTYVSPWYQIVTRFSDYMDQNPQCDEFLDETRYGESFTERKMAIEILIQQILAKQDCQFLHPLLQSFLPIRDDTWNYIKEIQDPRLVNLKDDIAKMKSQIHKDQAKLAVKVNFCGASDIGMKIWPYFDLLTRLKEIRSLLLVPSTGSSITQIKKDGEMAERCENVMASGDKDLKNFFVKIPMGQQTEFQIDFQAYGAKDRLKVFDAHNNLLHDSKCISGQDQIKLSADQLKGQEKLKFEVIAKCAYEPSTVWDISIHCEQTPPSGPPMPIKSPCLDDLDRLIVMIDQLLQLYHPLEQHYWKKVICYIHYDGKLDRDLLPPLSDLNLLEDVRSCDHCTPKENENYLKMIKQKIPNNLPGETYKQLQSSNIVPPKSQTNQPVRQVAAENSKQFDRKDEFLYKLNKSHFSLIKREYCELNKNRIDLFNTLSKRYCLSAFPKLIPSKQ